MLHTHVQEVGTLCRDKERVKSAAYEAVGESLRRSTCT